MCLVGVEHTPRRIYKVGMYFVLVAKWDGHYGSVLMIYVILLLLVTFPPLFLLSFFPNSAYLLVHMGSSVLFGSVCVEVKLQPQTSHGEFCGGLDREAHQGRFVFSAPASEGWVERCDLMGFDPRGHM